MRAGYLVLCDRYVFTAFARDVVRGCPPEWVRGIYNFAALPDLTFFFKADLEVSLHRILDGRPQLKYFEAGMDLRLSTDPYESFRIFQGRILEQYLAMSTEFNFLVIDANQRVEAQQAVVRELIADRRSTSQPSSATRISSTPRPLPGKTHGNRNQPKTNGVRNQPHRRSRSPARAGFTATAFPAWSSTSWPANSSWSKARTARAARRKSRGWCDWLEGSGHATVQVGLKRSTLVSEELEQAQTGKHSQPHHAQSCFTPPISRTSWRTSSCPR